MQDGETASAGEVRRGEAFEDKLSKSVFSEAGTCFVGIRIVRTYVEILCAYQALQGGFRT